MGKIGIAITSYNRPAVLQMSLTQWRKLLPKGAELVIVDDGSTDPVEGADFRFPSNAGIAAAKNACIRILMERGCEHLFLADSDTYPIAARWHDPYIKSGVKHLSFTFDRLVNGRPNGRQYIGDYEGLAEYGSPCGCMLYIHRSVVDTIGGFDVDYPQWGYEHVDFSNRAYNAGLTPAQYLDVPNSLELFHSMDYHCEVSGSVDGSARMHVLQPNKDRFERQSGSSEFMPYNHSTSGIILAAYFNANPDPQRGITWLPDTTQLNTLIQSCKSAGVTLKIFHDCLPYNDDDIFVKVPRQHHFSPNIYRWLVFHAFLEDNPIDNVFMVDSTDVEVLRNPFLSLNPNRLYVGDEYNMKVDNGWMAKCQEPLLGALTDYRQVIEANATETLPNCGIVGGALPVVMEYLRYRVEYHEKYTYGILQSTDMAIFNYILWKHFKGRMTSGIKVNTRFKQNEYNKVSFFKHK